MNHNAWHVLHMQTNHERKIAQRLNALNIEHYLPLYSERVQWSDRVVITERPLFAGYLFLRFRPDQRTSVLSLRGIFRLFGDEERDLVPEGELDRIKKGLAQGLNIRPHPGLKAGSRVRVSNGLFEGAEGLVEEFHRDCEVVISLNRGCSPFSLRVRREDLQVLRNK